MTERARRSLTVLLSTRANEAQSRRYEGLAVSRCCEAQCGVKMVRYSRLKSPSLLIG